MPPKRLSGDATSGEEFERRADAAYDRYVKPHITAADQGKFVALDVDSGLYELDDDELRAIDRLQDRCPNASAWLTRVGSRYAYRSKTTRSSS